MRDLPLPNIAVAGLSVEFTMLAFAIILNNFEGTSAEANQAVDAIAAKLASFTRTATPADVRRGAPRK